MKKCGAVVFVICALTGCTSLINPYDGLSPEAAASKIIAKRAPEVHIESNAALGGMGAMIFNNAELDLVVSDLKHYCDMSVGTIIPFKDNKPGFACYSSQRHTETFAVRTDANLMVMEKRANDAASFDMVAGLWGYVSLDQEHEQALKARQRALAMKQQVEAQQLEQLQARQLLGQEAGGSGLQGRREYPLRRDSREC